MEEVLKRKRNRLQNYDYSTCGGYFLTICTAERKNYFWSVGATSGRLQDIQLSSLGKIVDEAINYISKAYPSLLVKYYVIMPDHIHLLIIIRADEYGRPMVAPTMSRMVNQLKGYVTKNVGHSIWQKSFYDHIIRNKQDYEKHVKYIAENPKKWMYEQYKEKECQN